MLGCPARPVCERSKHLDLSARRASIVQHKPEVTGLSLNASHPQRDNPPCSATCAVAVGPRQLLQPGGKESFQLLLQTNAALLVFFLPPCTTAASALSSSPWLNCITPPLSKVSSSHTSQLCSSEPKQSRARNTCLLFLSSFSFLRESYGYLP